MRHLGRQSLRDVMVLAVQTTEVAARASQRKAACAGMKAIERLLLDRIVSQGARLAIDVTHHHAPIISAAPTKPMLALPHGTSMRTKQAFQPPILLFLIISTLQIVNY